jgi:hypothetical protein
MDTLNSKDKALAAVTEQSDALHRIVKSTQSSGDTHLGFEQLKRWKENTVRILAETVSEKESLKLKEKRLGSFMMNQPQFGSHFVSSILNSVVGRNPNEP